MKAIVLTFDRHRAITQHLILQYERIWPDHPFRFRIPYQQLRGPDSERVEYVESPPEIVTRGFVDVGEGGGLLEEASRLVEDALRARPREERLDGELTRERIRTELRRFFRKRTERRPMVIPVVMEV